MKQSYPPPLAATRAAGEVCNLATLPIYFLKLHSNISNLVRDIKAHSSKFINKKQWIVGRFEWQKGFSAFSYSHSQLDAVVRYIKNQEKHHSQKTFREEYLELLDLFGIDYDTKYVFESEDDDYA